ncbi:MAG TPA: hypothetical protein VI432_02870 [Candidatus Paceibacterota bacterium]
MRNTKAAFLWIVGLLEDLRIIFEVDGGLAAELYGSGRELADIDINIYKKDFEKLIPKIKEYIKFGPERYKDDHWDIFMITIKYAGQNIDIGAVDDARYFDEEEKKWVSLPADLSDVRVMEYAGINVPVINEIKLMIYKSKLGRGVDKRDVGAMSDKLFNQ